MTFVDPQTGEVKNPPPPKEPRGAIILAVFGLMVVTIGAVGGLAYDAIAHSGSGAITALVSVASIGIGALAAIAGGSTGRKGPNNE